ncbi:asparagine synthase-related protein [Nocardia sp. NPDC051321]|uniref:asparagine synthase-related protein n=1 Tax=Nocardia sp. NPDC051321 TaxID=3364323 RepID=UPI0037A6C45C
MTRILRHASGRPWLLVHEGAGADQIVTARAGQTVLAVIGEHAVSAAALARLADGIGSVVELERAARSWAGSLHVIASVAGMVWVRAPISGWRRTFHARVGGIAVAADRADVLAHLIAAEPDPSRVALALLGPHAPTPLGDHPMWRGVHGVPGGRDLTIDDVGRVVVKRWWTAPESTVAMEPGAAALRDALAAAVDLRTNGRDLVSTDLAGLDSTALCCLAARGPAHVVAYTHTGVDPRADDAVWARRTAAALNGAIDHHVIPSTLTAFDVTDSDDIGQVFDEPCGLVLDGRWRSLVYLAGAHGSRMHLCGLGGDELLSASPAHLHDMLPRTPRTALRNLRGHAALDRWRYAAALRQLLDRRPYHDWLARFAAGLTDPPLSARFPVLDWGWSMRMPPWATPAAAEAVRASVTAAAPTAEPLGHGHGQHRDLAALQANARMFRHIRGLIGRRGITLAAPYYDDHVIEAALSVRPQERVTPWRYKPLIVAATRGIVPDESRTRDTKGIGATDAETGLRRNRATLLNLCEDTLLARMGLIDEATLHRVCSGPLASDMTILNVLPTLACELWLRGLPSPATTSRETTTSC